MSGGNIYALFVSTHYPSDVTADGSGPVYYQQQVLATVLRSGFGSAELAVTTSLFPGGKTLARELGPFADENAGSRNGLPAMARAKQRGHHGLDGD